MSTREHLTRLAMEAINAEADNIDFDQGGNVLVNYARAAVDAVLPMITYPRQLKGVPERSLLVSNGGVVYEWSDGALTIDGSDHLDLYNPEDILADSPLTVVWMP